MSPEVHEMHEHAEDTHHDPSLMPVTFTIAVLAVVRAATSLLGHPAHTEELLLQTEATDQWAYYQAKNIRRHIYQLFLGQLAVSNVKNAEWADKVREKYTHEVECYKDVQKEIATEARQLENEVQFLIHSREALLEVGRTGCRGGFRNRDIRLLGEVGRGMPPQGSLGRHFRSTHFRVSPSS